MAVLFTGAHIKILFDNIQTNIESEIRDLADDYILSVSFDDLVQSIVDKYSVRVPAIDKDGICNDYSEGYVPEYPVPNSRIDMQVGVRGRIYSLHVPYEGDEHLFHYMPMPPPPNFAHGSVGKTEIVFTVGGAWHTKETINKKFDDDLALLEDGIQRVEKNIVPFNANLQSFVVARLAHRKSAAQRTRETTAGLKYKLRRDETAPKTYKLPPAQRRIAPKPVVTLGPAQEQEFSIDESDYEDILDICESMSLVMERSPTVFENSEEEHIRVHYLVQLNGQYPGGATGETFNNEGRTDILIRHENRNVFVAECKFWTGYKGLLETADQLLGYTTWRDTKTALIIFSRNLDFTSVILEAQRAMKDHACYKSGPAKEGESRFRYVFTHPNDKQRDIIVTLLMLDMPKPVRKPNP